MPLGWIVPDGTNRSLEEIPEKKITNGISPGGGLGAVIVCLPRLEKAFGTGHYLVDLDTGKVFAYIGQLWRRTGLYSAVQPFNTEELTMKIERYSRIMKMEMENEVQTPVTPLNSWEVYTPPPLPPMDDPDVYMVHHDVMTTGTRRNYTRDRLRAAITYINEYKETQDKLERNNSQNEVLGRRLRIIFGQVNNIRERIDKALHVDDIYRCRRNMRDVPEVRRFPLPQMMGQATTSAWVTWIREETNIAMMMLDEEVTREGDPEDPFNGTAGGIFQMPPGRLNSLTLPPPVHTPLQTGAVNTSQRRQIEGDKHSSHSQNTNIVPEGINQLQQQQVHGDEILPSGGKGDKHSTPPLDPNHTIREFHNQQ